MATPHTRPDQDSAPDQVPEKSSAEAEVREFLDLVSQRKQPLAAHLEEAERLAFSDGELAIYHRPDDAWLSNALSRKSNRSILDECSTAVWGEPVSWRLRESGPADAPVITKDTEPDPVLAHPTVQTALDIFGGTARAVGGEKGKTR